MDQMKEMGKQVAVLSIYDHCQCRPHGQRDDDGPEDGRGKTLVVVSIHI